MPIEALVSPFPKELTTPPVTKICLVMDLPSWFFLRCLMPGEARASQTCILKPAARSGKGPRRKAEGGGRGGGRKGLGIRD